ncbi:MAG TPA: hypothetical protein VKB79_28335 [Bryobacteraceae bacterium]|nr:hypothetical protein [Bryobacteraceae bacterium]
MSRSFLTSATGLLLSLGIGALGAAAADTVPPIINVSATPAILWPPNGRMITVTVSGNITDNLSGVNAGGATFCVYDRYGAIQPFGPVTVASDGSFSFTVQLQASLNALDVNGRQYSVTVRASDNAGNLGFGAAAVMVPHDQNLPAVTAITVDAGQPVVGPDGSTPANKSLVVRGSTDEHSSVFPPHGLGGNHDYLFFVATAENGYPGFGMAVLSGGSGPDSSGKWTFDYPQADGYGLYTTSLGQTFFAQVFNSPGQIGICPPSRTGHAEGQDQTFDLNYAAGGSVLRDPTDKPGSLLMVYEGANGCIANAGGMIASDSNSYISLSIATSTDYGKTWPTYRGNPPLFNFVALPGTTSAQAPNAPMGAFGPDVCMGNDCSTTPPPNYGRYPVVTPVTSLDSLMKSKNDHATGIKEQEISGFVDDIGGNLHPFIYATSGGMNIARAPLNGGTAPLQFLKWDGYGFNSNGIGGQEASFLPNGSFGSCETPAQDRFGSSISYVEDTRQYLLIFVCRTMGDPLNGPDPTASMGAAWFFSTSYDLSDPMQWTTPTEIPGTWSPFDPNFPTCQAYDGWYPTFMSLGKDATHLSTTGYVFYLAGCQTGGSPAPERMYSSRRFTMTITPNH